MPEVKVPVKFDPTQPVYCIKAFFYGVNNSSIRHASDHPLRIDQIPEKYRTEEYIRQGKITSAIPSMIAPETTPGEMQFNAPEKTTVNPIAIRQQKDEQGNILPQSTPESKRKATKVKTEAAKKATESKTETKTKS